jgi:hypothetical protein
MNKCYKIKVGIEEYPVKEEDLPRIISAMKTNDMVKLDCGIFRGQAILAVCQDFEEEKRVVLSFSPASKEQELIEENEKQLEKQKSECEICNHTGWIFVDKGRETVAKYCQCTVLKLKQLT